MHLSRDRHRRPRPGSTRRGRLVRRTAAGAGVAALLVVVAVLGVGWYFSGVAVAVGSHRFVPNATVEAVAPDESAIRLAGDDDIRRLGVNGLEWQGGYGRLGAVLTDTPTGVTRVFTPVEGRPVPGLPVAVDLAGYTGDPRRALGLDFTELTLPSDLGGLPTWYVPAAREEGTWAVFVHGHDSRREESLRYLSMLHARGMPVLVPTYRNDVGAPASPDGKDHLGDTEWRDVEPAVAWALDHGARDVVLFGWSMGAAVSLQFVDRSPLADAVRGLVVDSPVLDWNDVLQHQGRLRGLPDPVTAVARRLVGVRLDTDLARFDWVRRADALRRPMLVVHSDADDYVPDGPSRAVARARPDLVTYLDIPGAGHTQGWNVAPDRYRAALDTWLTAQGV